MLTPWFMKLSARTLGALGIAWIVVFGSLMPLAGDCHHDDGRAAAFATTDDCHGACADADRDGACYIHRSSTLGSAATSRVERLGNGALAASAVEPRYDWSVTVSVLPERKSRCVTPAEPETRESPALTNGLASVALLV